jgi:hypothetical protein
MIFSLGFFMAVLFTQLPGSMAQQDGTRSCADLAADANKACPAGFQGVCSAKCAPSFLPYYRSCGDGHLSDAEAFDASCRQVLSVDRPNSASRPDCGMTASMPVIMVCAKWTESALLDGQITSDDNFCSSPCHAELKTLEAGCSGQMSQMITNSFKTLAPLVGECPTVLPAVTVKVDVPSCNTKIRGVEAACGAPGVQDTLCTDACLDVIKPAWAACTDGVGGDQVAESLFKPYTAQIDSCDDKAQNDECAKTTTDFISFISKSCCDANDSSQCDGLPADCTPECGAVFMPYFSRCGRLVFQAPDALSHAGVNAPNADGTPSQFDTMEAFERKCAAAAGRTHVHVDTEPPGKPGKPIDTTHGGHAQLDGPDPSDPCSSITKCEKCGGSAASSSAFGLEKCGWCRSEITDAVLSTITSGGWCSSECVTTRGECSSFAGLTRGGSDLK